LSSGCIMKGIDSRDTGSCKTECKDDSVDDDKVVSDVEVCTNIELYIVSLTVIDCRYTNTHIDSDIKFYQFMFEHLSTDYW